MRVLIIDNSKATAAKNLPALLKDEGLVVLSTDDPEEGIELAKLYDYDAIVLNLVPHGMKALVQLRAKNVRAPVIVVSASNLTSDRIHALNQGADDFVGLPCDVDELVARLRAVVRRMNGHIQSALVIGDLVLDQTKKISMIGGKRVNLTPKEFQMVELLILRRGATITKEMFLNYLYDGRDEPELKIIDVMVCKIRKKFVDVSGGNGFIETVWGRGYRITASAYKDTNKGVASQFFERVESPSIQPAA